MIFPALVNFEIHFSAAISAAEYRVGGGAHAGGRHTPNSPGGSPWLSSGCGRFFSLFWQRP